MRCATINYALTKYKVNMTAYEDKIKAEMFKSLNRVKSLKLAQMCYADRQFSKTTILYIVLDFKICSNDLLENV